MNTHKQQFTEFNVLPSTHVTADQGADKKQGSRQYFKPLYLSLGSTSIPIFSCTTGQQGICCAQSNFSARSSFTAFGV